MNLFPLLLSGVGAAAMAASAADNTIHTFKKLHLEKYYRGRQGIKGRRGDPAHRRSPVELFPPQALDNQR